YTLVDIWCRSYQKPPRSVMLDIDDTVDVVHGHQQLAQWNAHYDERCFLPIHVYDAATGAPVVGILRPGKTPSGVEVRKLLRRLICRIRRHWPDTRITVRGDGHYGRQEAMTWCENNGKAAMDQSEGGELHQARGRQHEKRYRHPRGRLAVHVQHVARYLHVRGSG